MREYTRLVVGAIVGGATLAWFVRGADSQTGSAPVPPDNYNLVQADITHSVNTAFARVIGINTGSVTATSVAAHRPRDVTILIDFSGSMNEPGKWISPPMKSTMIWGN